MTPDQYRREGAEAMREAALATVLETIEDSGIIYRWTTLQLCVAAIHAIDMTEVLAKLRPRCAECDCEDGNCTWIKSGPAPDAVARLVEAARAEAEKAMRKFPQPNYVISKVAEEAGEVVKAAIHCAEGRETPEAVRAEIVQAMAMLIRLYVDGDQVHGLPALAAMEVGK